MTSDQPDPDQSQRHIVIRFLVEATALSKGIWPQFFFYKEPEVRVNARLEAAIRNVELRELGYDEDPEWFEGPGHTMEVLLEAWLLTNFPLLTFDHESISRVSSVLKQVGVWYDYSSMPQRPFGTVLEKNRFDEELHGLPELMRSSHVLIAWDKSANDRGWCLLEGVIAADLGNESYDAVPNTNWKIAVFDVDKSLSGLNPSEQIKRFLCTQARLFQGASSNTIENYFRRNNITCTRPEDLPVVCDLISQYFTDSKV